MPRGIVFYPQSEEEYKCWVRTSMHSQVKHVSHVSLFFHTSYDNALKAQLESLAAEFSEVMICAVDTLSTPIEVDDIIGFPGIEIELAPRFYSYSGLKSSELCHGTDLDQLRVHLETLSGTGYIAASSPGVRLELPDGAKLSVEPQMELVSRESQGLSYGGDASHHFSSSFDRRIGIQCGTAPPLKI